MLRNIVIGGGILVVLLLIALSVAEKLSNSQTPKPLPPPGPGILNVQEPTVEVADRSTEEILRQAQADFQRGQVYFREAAVGDENLWESIRFYKRAEAELGLLDPGLWPPMAKEIAPKIQRAQGMLDKEYRRVKVSFIGYYQSADWRRADEELNLLMRIIPADTDPRHKWAKKNKAKVKKRLRSMPKKKGPL